MLKMILLPLDGSPLAERALPYAAALARRAGHRVVLVEAVQANPLPGVDASDARVEVAGRAGNTLRGAARRLAAMAVTAEPHTYYADPVHAILHAADRQAADVIVMSTHGRGGFGRMLYGSVADQVLRHASVPVLLVPSIVEHAWPSDRPLRLLIPLDGSTLAEDALQSAELLAEVLESRSTLLRVVEPPSQPLHGDGCAYLPFDQDAELADARRYLQDQVGRLRERGRQAEATVAVGPSARVIAEIARGQEADVIVMTTHGHGGLSRLILGSVATSVLRRTTVPLLLARPSGLHRDEPGHPVTAAGRGTTRMTPPPVLADEPAGSTVCVRLSEVDLELIERGLKALAYAPGYDYGHVLAAQALAKRLKASTLVDIGEPVATRERTAQKVAATTADRAGIIGALHPRPEAPGCASARSTRSDHEARSSPFPGPAKQKGRRP
jgi:nucleotide-binding universal stress UspA family protein